MAQISFDAETVEPSTPYEVLPKGRYLCVAVASELKENKARNGEYLQITFEVIDGDSKGRKIFERLNVRNVNKQAEDIAQRTLSSLCRAVGVMKLSDSEQLHGIPVFLEVVVEEGKGEYGPQNRIKGYLPAGATAETAPAPKAAAPAAAAPKAAAANKPVWKRG